MARIKLMDTSYQKISEGFHVFQVVGVNYDEDFGKLDVTLQNKSGQKHIEKFWLMDISGEPNVKAYWAFSLFAKLCLQDNEVTDIDEKDLIGTFIRAEVKYVEGSKINERTGKKYVNAKLERKEMASSFDGEVCTENPFETFSMEELPEEYDVN